MTDPHAGLVFEATPISGGLPADPGRLEAAAALALAPDLRPAFVAQGAARDALERLFAGAYCVTTGQQPGLFTGPLYTIHKAITAVALARQAEHRLGRPVVPVFWVAGDDHDFAEANHTYVLNAQHEVVSLLLRQRDPSAPLTPLYREPVGPEGLTLLEQLGQLLPATDFRNGLLDWLGRHYRPEADLASAFAHALAELLGALGLVVFLPTHPAAKRAMAPWLRRLADQAGPLHQALVQRRAELEAAGRPAPVTVGDGGTNLMIEGSLGRDRLMLDQDGFVARRSGDRWTAPALAAVIEHEPERLSPNVLARPAIEAALLPTVAYVAGPGELAYWPQAAPVYRALGVPAQAAVPRWSGRLIEAKIRKVLLKHRITASDLDGPQGHLEAALLADQLPADAREALTTLSSSLTREYGRLREAALAIDPTLRKPIESARNAALASLAEVEKRLVAHLKKQHSLVVQQLDKARHHLFPLGRPQERVLNVISYLVRYGPALLDQELALCAAHAAALETAWVTA